MKKQKAKSRTAKKKTSLNRNIFSTDEEDSELSEITYNDDESSVHDSDSGSDEKPISVGDFVIVLYVTKKSLKHFVGAVETIEICED